MNASTQTPHVLLTYWLQGLWRNYLNELPLRSENLSHFAMVTTEEIANGHFSTSLSSIPNSGKVWIAPRVFEKANGELWIPLWLPATLNHTMLFVDHNLRRLPWIPASQFENGKSSLFSEFLHEFDEWLREGVTEKNTFIWNEWQELYDSALNFIEHLSEGCWQKILHNKGFILTNKAFIVNEENLSLLHANITSIISSQLSQNTISPLIHQYTIIDEFDANGIFNDQELQEKKQLISGSLTKKLNLSHTEYQALAHVLSLPEENFIAIKAPVSSQSKITFMRTLLASFMDLEARAKKTSLDLYLLTPCHNQNYSLSFDKIEDFQNDIDKIELNPEIRTLQAQDESAEKALNALLIQQEILNKKRKRSLFKIFSQIFLISKALELKDKKSRQNLNEKIRQIKVQRTKIHQQLVKVIESNIENSRAQNLSMHHSFSLALKYWQGSEIYDCGEMREGNNPENSSAKGITENTIMPGWKLLKLQVNEKIFWQPIDRLPQNASLLVVDDANRLLPQQVIPFLAIAKKVLFLGDNQDLPPKSVISAFQEEKDMEVFHFVDEEIIEQLHYKGQLQSTGNGFAVALANNYWQQPTDYGSWSSILTLDNEKEIHYEMISIAGKSEEVENGLCNTIEAHAIVDYLATEPFKSTKNIMIATPFLSQKILVQSLLKEANLSVDVFIVDELPNTKWDHVIFSPVYCVQDCRPFIFDQGDYWFYSLISRTKNTFWVIGNAALFNPKTHSPSGKLAKHLFKKEVQVS